MGCVRDKGGNPMIIETTIISKCPYCKNVNTTTEYIRQFDKMYQSIIMCDVDEGGCDQPYTTEYYVKIVVENSKKITGYK